MFEVRMAKQAQKFFHSIQEPLKSQLKTKLKNLESFSASTEGIKRMKGKYEGYYRLRVGKLRVVFYPFNQKK